MYPVAAHNLETIFSMLVFSRGITKRISFREGCNTEVFVTKEVFVQAIQKGEKHGLIILFS